MSVDCEFVRARLPEEVSGDLAPTEAAAVRRHVAGCSDCRLAWERVAAVLGAASAWEPPPLGQDFADVVVARAAAEGGGAVGRAWPRLAALAAAVLVAVSAWLLLAPRSSAPPPQEARLDAFAAGLGGVARRAERTGVEALAAFAEIGWQALEALPDGVPALEDEPVEATLQEGSTALREDLEESARGLWRALDEATAWIPWL